MRHKLFILVFLWPVMLLAQNTFWAGMSITNGQVVSTNGGSVSLFGTNKILMHQTNDIIYVQTTWTNDTRLEYCFHWTNTTPTGTFHIESYGISLTNSSTQHNVAANQMPGASSSGDDIPPLYVSWSASQWSSSYISGDHGWNLAQGTMTSHGFGVGDIIKDTNGSLYAITEIVDANKFYFAPTKANFANQSITGLPATNITKGITLTGYSQTAVQKFPCWKTLNQWLLVDGTTPPTNAVISGSTFEIGYSQILWTPEDSFNLASNNSSFVYTDCSNFCSRVLRMVIYPNGQMTTYDTVTNLYTNTWKFLNHGGMQALIDQANVLYAFPNGGTVNGIVLTNPFPSSSVSSTLNLTNTTSHLIDPNGGLNHEFAVNTNKGWGELLSYDPYLGNSAWNRTGQVWQIAVSTKKMYPYAEGGKVMSVNGVSYVVAHRLFFPFTNGWKATILRPEESVKSYSVTNQ